MVLFREHRSLLEDSMKTAVELEFSIGHSPDHYQLTIENIFKKRQYETLGIKE